MMDILESGNLRLRIGQRTVTIGVERSSDGDDESMVIDLDAIESWDDGEPVTMKELQRILAEIERECQAKGMDVEFE